MTKKINILIFIFVFFTFLFFHYNNIFKRIGFGWDQESYSYQVKSIIKDHKLTLIGPRNAEIKGFFLGPYFIYLLVPFYLITHLHPLALTLFIIVYNLLFFTLTFFLLNKISDFSTAIYFMFFWSINPQLVAYDTVPWNPVFIPLGIIINWVILYQIIKKNSLLLWILLGLTSGIFLNMHFQYIFILIFVGSFIIFNNYKNRFKNWIKIIIAFFSFLITFTPLLLFDLRHNFLNIKLFINFFLNKENSLPADLTVWLPVLTNLIRPLIFTNNLLILKFFYIFILILTIFLIKNNNKRFLKCFFQSFLIVWLVFPVFFSLYGKRPPEYYFLFLIPFIFFTLINFFIKINKKILLFILLIILYIFNFNSLKTTINEDKFGLYYKDKAIKKLKLILKDKNKFNISFKVPIGANNGYNYLIDYYQIKQSRDFNDTLVEIDVPIRPNDIKVDNIGLKIPKELK